MIRTILASGALAFLAATDATAKDCAFPVESNLKAGAGRVEITPEIPEGGMDVVGHPRRVEGVRDPLRAEVLVLDDGETRAAIVTFDLLGAKPALVEATRTAVSEAADVPADHVLVAASHNHSGPAYQAGSDWAEEVDEQIRTAAAEAVSGLRTVSIGYDEDRISFGINRRKVINGQAVVRLNPDGPNDPRVKVLRFDDGESLTPVAVLMLAVCHPCFFTWGDDGTPPYPGGYPKMSADFPGEAKRFIEGAYGGETTAMFLQGCAGDIRPNLPGHPYRCADESDIQWAGRDLGGAVVRALSRSVVREYLRERDSYYRIRCAREVVDLPGKDGPVSSEMMALKVGPYLFLTMPGEPMVEYGSKVEAMIADRALPIVVGYANGDIGYIATADSHEVGGYEPEMSPLRPEAEPEILETLDRLANQVIGDVFRVFSKREQDDED
jgi:neutral ceramidase